jgi:AcrR family transcriptional regulator
MVLTVSTSIGTIQDMTRAARRKPGRKRTGPYHHGDLSRALLEEALRTIQADGVEALTLRAVGQRLGVSRTALYRHFADKPSLLAAVGREGFRMLELALRAARDRHGRGRPGFEAMGAAYVQFAVAHPAHYRVMFGRFVESCAKDAAFVDQATSAFQVLVDSLVELQHAGRVRRDEPSGATNHSCLRGSSGRWSTGWRCW